MTATQTASDKYISADWQNRPLSFIGYIEIHATTPRALILYRHLVLASFLAGWDISKISFQQFEDDHFVSLHDFDWQNLCKEARKNLEERPVKSDWVGVAVNIIA